MEHSGPDSPSPSTVDVIARHAARQPGKIAIQLKGDGVTYERLHRDIAKMAGALEKLGLRPGQAAAVEATNFYLHWLILLAFDALGVATLSYAAAETPLVESTLGLMDLVMCPPGLGPKRAKRVHVVDQAWIDSIAAMAPPPPLRPVRAGPDAPFRIVKSSGTTGHVKAMVQSRSVHDARLERSQLYCRFGPETRYFVAMGFSVQAYHLDATSCLRAGGTCIIDDREPLVHAFAKYAISDVLLLPKVLLDLLDEMSPDTVKAPSLRVFVLGAPVSKTVRRRAAERLGAALWESYGTNETGAVCRMDADGTGIVVPGVRVETVDDDGQPVYGEAGRVRIQSDGCVPGYLDDPDASRAMFRDGWFYPGDIAVMDDSRTLRLVGRDDDLLNIRGIKYAPHALEETLARELPVADAAVTVIDDADGIATVWVAIVPAGADGAAQVKDRLAALLPKLLGTVKVAALDAIPRTSTGKIRRAALNEILRRHRK